MDCPRAVEGYSRAVGEVSEARIPGSTEAALRVVQALADVLRYCGSDVPKLLPQLVSKALQARPGSQTIRSIIHLFLRRVLEYALSSGTGSQRGGAVDRALAEVLNYVEGVREAVSEIGSRRLEPGDVVLTYSYSTTVLRILERAAKRGVDFEAYVAESRPIAEGRLMASALGKLGIRTTLVVDSAIRYVMKRVSKVLVGAEAIAANGAVVGKVGTSVVALVAKEARVRFYVAAGLYKFSPETVFGDLVAIEELDNPELIVPQDRLVDVAPYLGRGVRTRTPLYDVTPPEYVDAVITERGLIAPQLVFYFAREFLGVDSQYVGVERLAEEVGRLWS